MNTPFLPEWVRSHARRTPDAPAIATPEVRLSYRELALRFRLLSAHLAAAGVRPGDRVIVALPDLAAGVVAGLAIQGIGACVVEVASWRAHALSEIIQRTAARHVFVHASDLAVWADLARRHQLRLWVVEPSIAAGSNPLLSQGENPLQPPLARLTEDGALVAPGDVPDPQPYLLRPDDPALIAYTSGSTGEPRGVVQTWRNIDANTRSIVEFLGLGAQDRAMLVLPLSYCYGRSVLQTHLFVGGSVFLDDRFMYPRVVIEAIRDEGCTGFAGVPLTFEIIRRQVDMRSVGPLPLRYLTQAGGAMAPETISWVRSAFQPARLFVMYGQTEATARLSYLPPERAAEKEGSIGIAIPGVELRVVDGSGAAVPAGEIGNLVARGDNVTPGYLGAPEETSQILRNGWLWTGDLAWRDADGFLFHAGRTKDILKIGGHRVSPAEIEQAIARHPDVADAAVIGAREDTSGDVATALVVRRRGSTLTEAGLRRFCIEQLAPFKVPKAITFVDALPRNESGKLLRARIASEQVGLRVEERRT
jgi:acyl-CoA synthetase (AMP-forming)/AMP-acid ligase II